MASPSDGNSYKIWLCDKLPSLIEKQMANGRETFILSLIKLSNVMFLLLLFVTLLQKDLTLILHGKCSILQENLSAIFSICSK